MCWVFWGFDELAGSGCFILLDLSCGMPGFEGFGFWGMVFLGWSSRCGVVAMLPCGGFSGVA